jgi:hypothetical protein
VELTGNPRGVSEDKRDWLSIGTVIAALSQDAISNSLSYVDSLCLTVSVRNLCQRLLKLDIEGGLEFRIQLYQHFVGCLTAS